MRFFPEVARKRRWCWTHCDVLGGPAPFCLRPGCAAVATETWRNEPRRLSPFRHGYGNYTIVPEPSPCCTLPRNRTLRGTDFKNQPVEILLPLKTRTLLIVIRTSSRCGKMYHLSNRKHFSSPQRMGFCWAASFILKKCMGKCHFSHLTCYSR